MNHGKFWCVVNPALGIPLFLSGVVGLSVLVHTGL